MRNVLLMAGLVSFLGACEFRQSSAGADGTAASDEEVASLVRVANPHRGKLSEQLDITAVVEAFERADVFPRLEGTITKIHFVEGQSVKKNDILAEIECEEETLALESQKLAVEKSEMALAQGRFAQKELEAQFKGAQATLSKETRNFERAKRQHAQSVITDADLEQAQSSFNLAISEKERLEFSIEKLKSDLESRQVAIKESRNLLQQSHLRLEWSFLRATIDGVISQRLIKLGQKVTPAAPAYSLMDPGSLVLLPAIPQKELRHLNTGLAVEIFSTAHPNTTFTGRVEFISPEVSPEGGTVQTRVRMDVADPPLLPGMFVSGHIITRERENILLIPKKAILFDRDRAYVIVVEGTDRKRARKINIQRGIEDGTSVEYLPLPGRPQEIRDNTKIVTVGMDRLVDGSLVILESEQDKTVPTGVEGSNSLENDG